MRRKSPLANKHTHTHAPPPTHLQIPTGYTIIPTFSPHLQQQLPPHPSKGNAKVL